MKEYRPSLPFVVSCLISVTKFAFSDDVCFLPSKVGHCRAMIPRWYYDHITGDCRQFYFGGCYGNGNNFPTKAECLHKCQAFSCSTRYEALGCFSKHQSSIVPLGQTLLNERDMESKTYNGTLIDWLKWSEYLPSLLCRCARKAAHSGYRMFAIHNLGECWGTNQPQQNSSRANQCWDRFYDKECKTAADMCVGGPLTNYYYTLINDRKISSPKKKKSIGEFRIPWSLM